MNFWLHFLLLHILSSKFAFASSFSSSCLIVKNAIVFDGTTEQSAIFKSILVENGTITKISKNLELSNRKKRCKSLDAKNKFLIPGLIDAHTHLLAFDKKNIKSWKEALEHSAAESEKYRLSQGAMNAMTMLQYGFTSVRDLGNSGNFLDEKLVRLLQSLGKPHLSIFYSGPGMAIFPSQIDLKNSSSEYLIIDNKSDFQNILKSYLSHGALWIKVYVDNSRGTEGLISSELLNRVISKAHKNNLRVALHAEYESSTSLSQQSYADSIEHFYETPHNSKDSLKTSFIVLTEVAQSACLGLQNKGFLQESCQKSFEDGQKRFLWMKKNRKRIVFGSDAVLDFTSDYKTRGEASIRSLIGWSRYGLSNYEILKAATSDAGDLLEKKIGKIASGYKADFILYEKSPLADLTALLLPLTIVKEGKVLCRTPGIACINEKY